MNVSGQQGQRLLTAREKSLALHLTIFLLSSSTHDKQTREEALVALLVTIMFYAFPLPRLSIRLTCLPLSYWRPR